jgi:hypothetical protein
MHNKHHKPGTVPLQSEGTDKDGSVGSCLLSTVGRSGRDNLLSIANPCNLSPLNIILCKSNLSAGKKGKRPASIHKRLHATIVDRTMCIAVVCKDRICGILSLYRA